MSIIAAIILVVVLWTNPKLVGTFLGLVWGTVLDILGITWGGAHWAVDTVKDPGGYDGTKKHIVAVHNSVRENPRDGVIELASYRKDQAMDMIKQMAETADKALGGTHNEDLTIANTIVKKQQ